jgi:hypothetical protein
MKNYYETLGVPVQANEQEIKRAYRKLVVAFHPDKNPSIEAGIIIKEINEAYEVLGDSEKRSHYDLELANPYARDPRARHRDPAYRRKYQPGYKPPPPKPSARMELMKQSLGVMRVICFFGMFCSFAFAADYFLPPVIVRERVIIDMHEIRKLLPNNTGDLLVTTKGHHFPAQFSELKYFPEASRVKIYTSRIFSLLICVESEAGEYQINNLATIYRNFSFGPIVLFLFSFAALVGRRGLEFRFTIGIAIMMMMFLNLIFVLISRI